MMSIIKKHGLNILFSGILLLLLFSPTARGWLLNKLLYTGLFNVNIKKNESPARIAPALVFFNSSGETISTDRLIGKTVFINFWATWCPPCIAEMPTINSLHKKLQSDTNIVFIMADVDRDLGKSSAFLKDHNFDLPVYIPLGEIPASIMSGTVPTTVIIDRNGKLVKKIEGMANYNSGSMIGYLKSQ